MRDALEGAVAEELGWAYGLEAVEVGRVRAGTATDNFRVVDGAGRVWFAKVYRDLRALGNERAAIGVAEFARGGGVPVPGVRRTRGGDVICATDRLALSVWEFVGDAETAEGGLSGERWAAVGAVLGRLHRRLAGHPAGSPVVGPGSGVRDVVRSRANFDRLIKAYRARAVLDDFEQWALEAACERRGLLGQVAAILERLPGLTQQVVHGDLASPNLMLRGDEVAAVIDFQPPAPRHVAWELARIGCDPRTVILGDEWLSGLPALLLAYRNEYPAVRLEDLLSTVAVGCAYTVASTYPLAEPLENPAAVTPGLRQYARARHDAALVMLNHLDEAEAVLRDQLG